MPFYHPIDTKDIFATMNKSLIDNLWYVIHFNQFTQHREAKGLEKIKPIKEQISPSSHALEGLKKTMLLREMSLSSLNKTHHISMKTGKLLGKLVHGMGAAHVRETSLTLHPLYGVPYIPASSLKGALRNWVLQAFFNGNEVSIEEMEEHGTNNQTIVKIFIDLFGNQERRGLLQCYDAFCDDFLLKPDILTVHFKDYYGGSKPATDNQSPNPISFYVVEKANFHFVMTMSKRDETRTNSGLSSKELFMLATNWFVTMLKEQGIGSKTSSGYGYFNQLSDETEERLKIHIEKKEELQKKQFEIEEEKRKAFEEEEQRKKLEGKLAAMTPSEHLTFEIANLDMNKQFDQDRSKNELYEKVIEMAALGEFEPAKELKKFWQQTNSWKVNKKKKQFEKVKKLKELLCED
ncbi:type III-B CRISPR module RAMP protein Cmr6 [Bacillus sp. HMF5848]|uniref:type III-B CRISPR module RAMP protein Cmr6 n=1 Tax=Bacillus sp. HMF5848 TaxID=2495421 RepID=UPI000F769262|nr:type III-B CRISPR module RAMP protein Cmr6 [Bacillus sp. HMF5848]RSK26559.1 type III-B CRISPR module RAMP protein Cmr6 [Bacillus sp. HMF5848]